MRCGNTGNTALFDRLAICQGVALTYGPDRELASGMAGKEVVQCAQYPPIAQLVEHLAFNQGVPGSNPGGRTKQESASRRQSLESVNLFLQIEVHY